MTEEEGELIKNADKNDDNLLEKSKTYKKLIIFFVIGLILILVIIIIILIFTIFKNDNKKNEKESDSNESNTELDTISKEEFDKARKSFKQLNYTESDSLKILSYNLFIPQDYSPKEKYPLIMFITDRGLVGKEITAPLTETVGGPIWATDTVQKKHKCFVLVSQYNEEVVNGSGNKSEYLNMTLRLISHLEKEYNIDHNRIYGTGQSMGAMTTLFLLANHDIFAAGLLADGFWLMEELDGLVNATFTFCAAEGDLKPFTNQNEIKEYFNSLNIKYGSLDLINARDNVEILNKDAQKMYDLGYKYNFISYAKGTVLPPNSENKSEHMASFKYTYRIDVVRDWLFMQTKE